MSLIIAVLVVWTAVAVVGIGVSTWGLIDGFYDGRALRSGNGDRRLIVKLNMRTAWASLFLHSLFLLLGVLALMSAPRPDLGFTQASALTLGYFLVAVANVRAVSLNQLDRWHLRREK